MRIVRYMAGKGVFFGVMRDDGDIDRLEGTPFDSARRSGEVDARVSSTLLCPVEGPRIIGVAYNYKAHTDESGKEQPTLPVLFMKPSTAAIGPDEPVVFPEGGEIVHYEGELVAIIGRKVRRVSVKNALDFVLGYTCGNDISDRVVQRQESKFGCLFAGKGYDTFAPLGPWIETHLDPTDLQVILRQNGVVKQSASTGDLVHPVAEIVSYLSRFMTLLPGDAVMTGTPAGVGPIAIGDVLEVEIPGIGVLRNSVRAEVPTS
jgi:2-keto-4-pentenoate hydratase/2-oxohepta-3-ene-1,7-dioic acid hydratase in catechol pathway